MANALNFAAIRRTIWFKLIIAFVVLVLLVILMDKVVMPAYVRLGHESELPDVVELTVDEAAKTLEQKGFDVILADSAYDAHYPAGVVIEQMPYAYSTVKKGRNVYLTVSIGQKPIIMPNLFSKSPREAELLLSAHGLELGKKYYEYSDIGMEGAVINQSFPQGQKIKKGRAVDITISLGPMPERKVFPSLVNESLDVAKKKLQILGVRNINIEYVDRENILPETVISQSVEPGQPISADMQVVLKVSKIEVVEEDN
jgi:serine/threonine-protein kinase